MSLVLNMVGGAGGAGLKETDAVLVVTVPTGSTVTATKGGVTLTPTMWVQAADNTLDCAIFSIKASLFDASNPWTVTATRGASHSSRTVVIDTNEQYDLRMAYEFWIFNNGVTSYTWSGTGGSITNNQLSLGTGFGGSDHYLTSAQIDVTNFNSLCAVSTYVSATSEGDLKDCRVGLASSLGNTAIAEVTLFAAVGESPGIGQMTLDISALTGSYYIGLFVRSNKTFRISQIWLEG